MPADKKQVAILGLLVVVILAVGAFQFTSASKPAAAPVAEKKEPKADEVADNEDAPIELRNPMFASALPSRDPFRPVALPGESKGPLAPPVAPVPQPRPQPRPDRMVGDLPPMPVAIPNGAQVPTVNGGLTSMPVEKPFAYALAGVIVGERNAAVFVGPSGTQQLVPEKGWLDGETQVVMIDKTSVLVKFGSKKLTLKTGGNPK